MGACTENRAQLLETIAQGGKMRAALEQAHHLGKQEGRREVVDILRKLGYNRPADDIMIYLGRPEYLMGG